MNISDLFLYYAIFAIIFAFIVPMILEKSNIKLVKKHAKKRKTIFTVLVFSALILLWSTLEKSFSDTTTLVLFSLHALCFITYLGFSIKKYCDDKKRITFAKNRRMKREDKSSN
ncbi:TPA: hypothetical protein EYP45_04370 [Candidatus Peregrinibacteria bacterium]|nr:hypothetical protein [Candidatus Peregrinibacteria bacterium]HIQ57178.1 hypothetical protein [Candidatus Gracilibacteria bacterium]